MAKELEARNTSVGEAQRQATLNEDQVLNTPSRAMPGL